MWEFHQETFQMKEIKKGIDILNDIEDYVPVLKTDIEDYVPVIETKIDDLWNVEVEASGAVDNKVLPTEMSRMFGLPNDLDSLTRTIETVQSERDELARLIGLYPPQKGRKIKLASKKQGKARLLGPAPVREEFEIFSFIEINNINFVAVDGIRRSVSKKAVRC